VNTRILLAELLRYNVAYLANILKKVSPESYFVRPENRGNPLIWLLGHIVVNRGEIIEILGGNARTADLVDLFARGTVPENKPSMYPEPSDLIARMIKMSSLTDHLLERGDPAVLDKASWGRYETVGQNVAYSYMHETHHIGQVAYVVNLPAVKTVTMARTVFRKPERENSTRRIILEGIKSVFS
jgi:uncharacterized damage-inducible protein DinB